MKKEDIVLVTGLEEPDLEWLEEEVEGVLEQLKDLPVKKK